MVSPIVALYLSVAVVSLIALVGVVTLSLDERRLHTAVDYLVSFSAGTLFGGTFLHLLPETAAEFGFTTLTGLSVLAGLVLAFVVEKYIAWHHHHHPDETRPEPVSYMILLGDGVHNLIDGVIIAGSYLVSIPLGVATTVAIAFHEIPQELGDFGVLVYGGMSRRRAVAYNFLSALTPSRARPPSSSSSTTSTGCCDTSCRSQRGTSSTSRGRTCFPSWSTRSTCAGRPGRWRRSWSGSR